MDGAVHALVDLAEGHRGELVRDGEVIAAGLGKGERVLGDRCLPGASRVWGRPDGATGGGQSWVRSGSRSQFPAVHRVGGSGPRPRYVAGPRIARCSIDGFISLPVTEDRHWPSRRPG